jgi:hypothetical protein
MSYFLQSDRPRVSDIEYHIAEVKNRLPLTQLFEKHVIWGDRLRQLKAYMDSQKPVGIVVYGRTNEMVYSGLHSGLLLSLEVLFSYYHF